MPQCLVGRAPGPRARAAAMAFCTAAFWWAAPAGAAPAVGTAVKGTVRYVGAPVGQSKVPVTIDQYVCGKEKENERLMLSPEKGIRYAVVSLKPPPAGAKWDGPVAPVQVDQKQCAFVPRVVVVPVGGTVEFLNSDRLLHNLHSRSTENPTFNRTQPRGRSIPISFAKPEIVPVDCDLHSWMRAWVVVAEHPFYAVTDERGEFTLANVPPGKYTLEVWQESLGTVSREVTVGPKGTSSLTVEMGKK